MDKSEMRKFGAVEDLKRMRVYESDALRMSNAPEAVRRNFKTRYKSLFGIEPHRTIQLRRILEQAAQYGDRDFQESIDASNAIPERLPAQPYAVMFDDLQEEVGRNLLLAIQKHADLATQWELQQKRAERSGDSQEWEKAGALAMQYIDAVGIDPASREFWMDLYKRFFQWKESRRQR